ncbi:uncharacterized protein LOC141647632 [Silene latifolia]|uniref:uncharacterized protein LOC141647632 n=1 Tax=Silene latifolia TaxID=37657 RepID=UPI003D7725B0
MEGKGLSGRMYPNMGAGMPLQTQNPQSNLQNHSQIMGFQQQIDQQQTQLSMRQPNYPSFNPNPNSNPNPNPNPNPSQNGKIQATQVTNSDEDEPNDQENSSSSSLKRKAENSNNGGSGTIVSPWQRMKWTDNMVRLLIMAVYYIGDEVVGVGPELGSDKKKPGFGGGGGGGGGAMQKKGKWKSVSRAMMEKGFYVSPQQCEDKFNDLNKRYKRVNDILGKGTACKVVENQTLLETMDISSKMKEEVRKLLNSKHLFFREMCAYHNSCGHVTATNANVNGGGETAVVVGAGEGQMPAQVPPQQNQTPAPQGQVSACLHSTQLHPSMVQNNNLGNEDEDDDDEDEDDDDDDEDDDADDNEEGGNPRKRGRTMQGGLNQWSGEVRGMLQDGSKSTREKKQWMMAQMMELEENGVKYQREALELEKERLKWLKFSSKKEREMEKMKLANERKRLENERMVLLLRKKEIEFMIVEQQQNPAPVNNNTAAVNPSCISV